MLLREIKFGTIISIRKEKYFCKYGQGCSECDLRNDQKSCDKYECRSHKRKDGTNVIFKKIRKLIGDKNAISNNHVIK